MVLLITFKSWRRAILELCQVWLVLHPYGLCWPGYWTNLQYIAAVILTWTLTVRFSWCLITSFYFLPCIVVSLKDSFCTWTCKQRATSFLGENWKLSMLRGMECWHCSDPSQGGGTTREHTGAGHFHYGQGISWETHSQKLPHAQSWRLWGML